MAGDGTTVVVAIVSGVIGFAGGALTTVTAAIGNWRGRVREDRAQTRDALVELQRTMVGLIGVREMEQDERVRRTGENHFAIARFGLVAGTRGRVMSSLAVLTGSTLMASSNPSSALTGFSVVAPEWFEGASDARIVRIWNAATGMKMTVKQLRDLPEAPDVEEG